MSADIFDGYDRGTDTTGVWDVEARVAAKHPPIHRMTCHNKNYLSQNANGAKVEKLNKRFNQPDIFEALLYLS